MREEESQAQDKKTSLALAIARGQSVTAWARKNDIPVRSAFRWASDPMVRKSSEMWRRAALDMPVSVLLKLAGSGSNAGTDPNRVARRQQHPTRGSDLARYKIS